jgi:hypothetical protein
LQLADHLTNRARMESMDHSLALRVAVNDAGTISVIGGTVGNTATVTQADLAASNGVIHIIDSILEPPAPGTTPAARPALTSAGTRTSVESVPARWAPATPTSVESRMTDSPVKTQCPTSAPSRHAQSSALASAPPMSCWVVRPKALAVVTTDVRKPAISHTNLSLATS